MPELEGDKVTFIGSTFINFGEKEPYLNHIIALNDCSKMKNVENAEIECYKKERNVLKAWTNLVQRERPNMIIGYNIFGFDWKFMLERAEELSIYKYLSNGEIDGARSKLVANDFKK